MKKYLLIPIIYFSLFSVQARNAKEVFLSMPIDMLSDVSVDNRMDLVESFEAHSQASVQNKFNEDIFIENMTEGYFRLNMGNTNLQIIVLDMINESQLCCFIRTTCAPLCDSRIEFYSMNWKKLDENTFISKIPLSGFINKTENYPLLSAIELMQFDYNIENKTLSQKNNSVKLLSLEDQNKIKFDIKKEKIEYQWTGVRFEEKTE